MRFRRLPESIPSSDFDEDPCDVKPPLVTDPCRVASRTYYGAPRRTEGDVVANYWGPRRSLVHVCVCAIVYWSLIRGDKILWWQRLAPPYFKEREV